MKDKYIYLKGIKITTEKIEIENKCIVTIWRVEECENPSKMQKNICNKYLCWWRKCKSVYRV